MASSIEPRRATFRSFAESTKEDWDDLTEQYKVVQGRVASQVIEQLEKLRGEFLGYPVDRLEHSLQTATRAERDGRDEEYVVCALVHDIGDSLAPTITKPSLHRYSSLLFHQPTIGWLRTMGSSRGTTSGITLVSIRMLETNTGITSITPLLKSFVQNTIRFRSMWTTSQSHSSTSCRYCTSFLRLSSFLFGNLLVHFDHVDFTN